MDKEFERWLKQDELFDFYNNNPEQQKTIFEDYQKEKEFVKPANIDDWLEWMVKNPELAEKHHPMMMHRLVERILISPPYKTARIIQSLPHNFPAWKTEAEELVGVTKQKMIQQQIALIEVVLNFKGHHEIIQEAVKSVELELLEEKDYWENQLKNISNQALEKGEKMVKAKEQEMGDFNNSQLVLIFYYFFKYCGIEPRNTIDIAPMAKFIHLITGKEFTNTSNSDFYKKLQKVPNFKTEKELIKDLQRIKPLFERVQLSEIVKMIDNELDVARSEMKNKGR